MRETPAEYFSSLGSIVLTNAAAVGPGKTRRVQGRKFKRDACRGFYHHKHGRTPAFIEIVVDNSIAGAPAYVVMVNLTRDMLLGAVLFHEVGHHLDVTIGAAARTGEAAAEDWGRRLFHLYYKRRYWWLLPFGRVIRFIGRWGSRRLKSRSRTG